MRMIIKSMKKINIIILFLVLLMAAGAVAASEVNDTIVSQNSTDELSISTHTISDSNYNQYFDVRNGNMVSSNVSDGDSINLDGTISDKSLVFNKKVNIIGTSSNSMKNSMITLLAGASGSTISNLNIENTNSETYGIFLNSASNCIVKNCIITNTGKSSYCICLANNANYNKVDNNQLTAYGITYGHGSFTRSTPPLLLSNAHYNQISNNHVEADDANGIYLSSYSGGPLSGGDSNFNTIFNNTIHYNVLPTSWAYGIQVMGNNNTIKSNKVIGGYRGVSTAGSGNIIIGNTIINLTGADYNHPGVESGGEYAIVASYNSIAINNTVIGAKVISTGAGISAIDNSIVENNWVNVTLNGRGIVAGGYNVVIRNNTVFTQYGSGIYEKDEGSGLLIEKNNITSITGVGILLEKLSSKRMPSNVTVINNTVLTGNDYAIDASGVQANTSFIDIKSNIVYKKLINTPAGVIDVSKANYIYNGKTITITPSNFDIYINANGGLTSYVSDDDILSFQGTFTNKVIYITKGVEITGTNPVFYNTTFKVTTGNVLIENLTIINKDAERVNAWGIFVNQASGVRIVNNKISVTDPKAAYAIYVLDSSEIDVFNNELTSEGDFLTFTLLSYACEECRFENNTVRTIGTGTAYKFSPEKCIDGNEVVIDGVSYCIDGNELVIDGKSYCIDGNELVIDGKSYKINSTEIVIGGKSYCIDGGELVIDGKTYCIDGGELVIDGKSYGTVSSNGNAHVVSEIYQTYGILLLYSSFNKVSGNNVNATSKLNETYKTMGNESSQNSLVGIDLYFNCHNNTLSDNTIFIKANDNYIYGMGVLGYFTGHTAPKGQGATYNNFINNTIDLEGCYCVEGIIIGDESEYSLIQDNKITLKSEAVIYGIYFEMSQKSYLLNNALTLTSQAAYSIQGYNSNNNIIIGNVVNGNGKDIYGILLSNANNNTVKENKINANGSGEDLTFINLDSISTGNGGIYLKYNSTNNLIQSNEITSNKNYAVLLDGEASDNIIDDNYLVSENTFGNSAVNNSDKNTVTNNYRYIAQANTSSSDAIYLGSAQFNVTLGEDFNGAIVEFYNMDDELLGNSTVINGTVSYTYQFDESYTPASYIFKAKLLKENYKKSAYDILFAIDKADPVVVLENISIIQGDTGYITVKIVNSLGKAVSGASVHFNRISYSRNISIGNSISDKNGIAKVSYTVPPSLDVSNHEITAHISGLSCYNDIIAFAILSVLPRLNVTININSNIYTNSVIATLTDSNNESVAGKEISVKIGQTTYSIISNAKGELVIPKNVKSGNFLVDISSQALGKYSESFNSSNVKIVSPIIGGGDYSLYYGNTIKYKVRIFDLNGNPIRSGKNVVFMINGKSSNVKTDNSGYAVYSVKLSAGSYTITAKYGDFSISNKILFKAILSAKNIAVKKAKKIKFSVKAVNKNGKIVKNKKILFKIKNKKYTAKTNKKGIATAVIKNLNAGKHTITSSYAGCSIKNIITVKK